MNIAIIGFGSMGKTVARIAAERKHTITAIIDPQAGELQNSSLYPTAKIYAKVAPAYLKDVDVAIDFSTGSAIVDNLKTCLESGINLVAGTTGWLENLDTVKNLAAQKNIGFMWSSNFSIGVNVYFKMIEAAAKLMNSFDEYDIWGHEIHHFNKADSPSGTAKTLEKILLSNIKRKTKVVEEKLDRKREPEEIHFSSLRGGAVNFGHTIGFDSEADTITITHNARNREGYALGAVKAAEWLKNKKGYFEMENFLNDTISS